MYDCHRDCETLVLLQVPIMLRSDYCSLHDQDDVQLSDLGECPYDQVPCNSHLAQPCIKLHIFCGVLQIVHQASCHELNPMM